MWIGIVLVARAFTASAEEANSDSGIFTNSLEMLQSVVVSGTDGYALRFDTNSFFTESTDVFANGAAEVRSKAFLRWISDVKPGSDTKIPLHVNVCITKEGLIWIDFRWKTNDISSDESKLLRQRIRFYVYRRLAGHTSNYVYAAVQESKGTNYVLPPGFPVALKKQYWIPSKWIPAHPVGDFTQGGDYWVVRDGKYAWVYPSLGLPQKRDPLEYDPKLKNKFEAARKEAIRNLTSGGQFLDSQHLIDFETQSILKKRYHIDWTPPEEIETEYNF